MKMKRSLTSQVLMEKRNEQVTGREQCFIARFVESLSVAVQCMKEM